MNHRYAIVRNTNPPQTSVAPETAQQRNSTGSQVGSVLGSVADSVGGARFSAISAAAMLVAGGWLGSGGSALAATGSCGPSTGAITVATALSGTCSLENDDKLTVDGPAEGSIDGGLKAVFVGSGISNASIVNSGTLKGSERGVDNRGKIRSVSNSGTILAVKYYGVSNNFSSEITTLDNTGTIKGSERGVHNGNNSTITTLDNSGTIEGGSYGVQSFENSTITTLDNSGTIEGGSHGVLSTLTSTITTLDNSGTIKGGNFSVSNTANSTLTTLNNSGSLIGDVQTQNTTINLSGTSARIVGNVVNNNGSINLLSGAHFTPEGTFTSATFTVAHGATLRVLEGKVADITGDYTQSGTLRIGASNNTNHGRLSVKGNAVLTPDATFVVDVNAVNTLANGQTLAGVVSATGTMTNNAPSSNVSDNSALFDFESSTNGKAVDLKIIAAGPAPAPAPDPAPSPSQAPSPRPKPAPSPVPAPASKGIVAAVLQNGLPNGVPAATVLDGFIRGGPSSTKFSLVDLNHGKTAALSNRQKQALDGPSDWDAVVTALGRLPTNATVAAAVGQAMPFLHGNAALVGLNHSKATASAIDQQQAQKGSFGEQSAGDNQQDRNLWVKPLGNWIDQNNVDGASGYKMNTQGIVGGVQADLNASSSVGLALAYIDSDVRGKRYAGTHSGDIQSMQLAAYGQQALSNSPWSLGWQTGYTRSRVESERALGFINRTAQGKYNADVLHLGLGVNRDFVVGTTTIRPGVNLDWRQFNAKAYSETGAGALSLDMQAQKARETVLKLSTEVQHELGSQLQLLAGAGLGYDLQSADHAVTARFSGGGAAFTTPGLPRARTVAELGMGMRYQPTETMAVTAHYDISLSKGLKNQTASVHLGWQF